jgi:hypothetical protein
MFRFDLQRGLPVVALLFLVLSAPTWADQPTESREELPPLELTVPSKHSGQVSFGFGTHGAFSQMSGMYTFSPRLYARYGLGVSQGFGRPDLFASSLTGNNGVEATQYFFSLGTPSLFQFGGGIHVGAEVFMSNGPLYHGSWLAPGFSPYGLGFYDAEASSFMSPWHQRAWNRAPLLEGNSWYIQVDVQQTTDQGTQGARVTVGK